MRTRVGHGLAAVLALAGHVVGVVGMPLPASPASPTPVTTAKLEKKCCCACGDGCGPCCCCSGGEPAGPEPATETAWHWSGSVQVQKCFGVGPSGLPDLPPGLPPAGMAKSHPLPVLGSIPVSPSVAVMVTMSPPTPPPRSA
jgi:hypothetical protein